MSKSSSSPEAIDKNKVRKEVLNYLSGYGKNIKTKLSNVCSKTGQYNVPSELFQKRTPRSNRVLLPWRAVKKNNLTLEQLNTFEGGVVVEFMNNDYFDDENKDNPVFLTLRNKLGSDDNVSSIISIRSEGGSSSSEIPRRAFKKLTSNTNVIYNDNQITINLSNYKDYAITKLCKGGTGNEKWTGFLYVSIRGGQQDTIETHHDQELTLFNPACEYASRDVRIDLDLVVSYFIMIALSSDLTGHEELLRYNKLMKKLELALESITYSSAAYEGNLLAYCKNHYSVKMVNGELTDPIQLKKITIENFNKDGRTADSIDFTHSEAVTFEKYYWDLKKKTILSPARPTNIFWSLHLSNMMQQDFTLDAYFAYEKQRYEKRQSMLNK